MEQFSQLIQKQLPSYAVPLFIRFIENFEQTATHKIRKATLKKEGIDGYATSKIFILLPKMVTYQPLTPTIFLKIQKGNIAF